MRVRSVIRPERPGSLLGRLLLMLVLGSFVAGCGAPGLRQSDKMTMGLSFVPNIQFAPFYVADSLGYFKDAGVQVEFHHHGAGEDLFGAVVAGREDMIFAG